MFADKIKQFTLPVVCFVSMVLVAATSVAFAASGGDNGGGGWAATDTYRVMNFSVLAIGLFFILRKPVSQFLSDRIQGIRDQLKDLEAQKIAAEKKLAEYNEKLAALSREADKIVAQYRQQGEAAREKIMKEAENAAMKLEDQARRNIENEFAQARLKLETEVFEKALAKAESRLKDLVTDDDQDRLVQDYLNKVVTK